MTWTKLDDGFWRDPKMADLSVHARMLYVSALNWSCDQLTDGFVSRRDSRRIMVEAKPRHIAELVASGLWFETESGFNIANFLDYQPSKADVELKREQWRLRKAKAREHGTQTEMSRSDSRRDSRQESQAESRSESARPDPTRPEDAIASPPEEEETNGEQTEYWIEQWALITGRTLTPKVAAAWQPKVAAHIQQFGPPTSALLHKAHEAGILNPAGWEFHMTKTNSRPTRPEPTNGTCDHLWADLGDILMCSRCKAEQEKP